MSRRWVKGWNGGLTGPNTPSTPTVSMSLAMHAYHEAMSERKAGQPMPKYPSTADYYIPIALGSDTVAIAVGSDRERTADLIVKADRMEDILVKISEVIDASMPPYSSLYEELHSLIKEALR
jgi:hypothetical protein